MTGINDGALIVKEGPFRMINSVLLPSFDFLGRPRIFGREVDIGPIEFTGTAATGGKEYE